ncbi:MAG: DUF2862 domain-containing protein [Leptolyngbyaceae cyanobacterium MO_188.B28]|nr:DUF2862 domain-containing protein [Leptolyngbyaceae cyanobacterium MO_188.B28]
MQIGQKVTVNQVRDRVSKEVSARVGQSGVVQQYKMVDGSDVGVVVEFNDKFTTWFFEDELTPAK